MSRLCIRERARIWHSVTYGRPFFVELGGASANWQVVQCLGGSKGRVGLLWPSLFKGAGMTIARQGGYKKAELWLINTQSLQGHGGEPIT